MRALFDGKLPEQNSDARGLTVLEDTKNQNFILIFGCKSGTGIAASSVMAQDCYKAMINAYSSDFTCQFSDVLDALQGTDVNFEIVKAQTVRPLKLEYVHNKARILKAHIFTQSELKGFQKYEIEDGEETDEQGETA